MREDCGIEKAITAIIEEARYSSARVLSDVDLAVDNNEVVLVAGHSRPGKTIPQHFGNLVDCTCGLEGVGFLRGGYLPRVFRAIRAPRNS
ncbi:MAG: hypothetical protein ACO2OR_04170 [Desulfurococcaceae archaeon]